MYVKCGALPQAHDVLDKLTSRDVVAWNALISGYAQKGQGQQALECLGRMKYEGILPDAVTYACILKVYAAIGVLDKGKQIHDEISRQGFLKHNRVLGNALVDMYAKCGGLAQAQSVLEKLPYRDREGILPDAVTYVAILKACAVIRAFEKGRELHDEISRHGLLEHNIILGTALVDMYAKCGALAQAQSVFEKLLPRNVVSWNALITGYVQVGQGQQALKCFSQMQQEGILPNRVTYLCILKACAGMGALDKGKELHKEILRRGFLGLDNMLGYAPENFLSHYDARSVLEELPFRDVVSWNALIAGFVQKEQGLEALKCFRQMQHESILPDEVTDACILRACTAIGAIDEGKQIHVKILSLGLSKHNIGLGTALGDMYTNGGALSQAQSVLEKLSFYDVISWNALIAAYAQEGQGQQALKCFQQMQRKSIWPNLSSALLGELLSVGQLGQGGQEEPLVLEAMAGAGGYDEQEGYSLARRQTRGIGGEACIGRPVYAAMAQEIREGWCELLQAQQRQGAPRG
ncbi:hypothetical protein L7F22_021986 [Adiantum nelumboides]|nr:hypothetical protein [Adiantum nelumboides]